MLEKSHADLTQEPKKAKPEEAINPNRHPPGGNTNIFQTRLEGRRPRPGPVPAGDRIPIPAPRRPPRHRGAPHPGRTRMSAATCHSRLRVAMPGNRGIPPHDIQRTDRYHQCILAPPNLQERPHCTRYHPFPTMHLRIRHPRPVPRPHPHRTGPQVHWATARATEFRVLGRHIPALPRPIRPPPTKAQYTSTVLSFASPLGFPTHTASGVPRFTGHSCRATGAVYLAEAGVDVWRTYPTPRVVRILHGPPLYPYRPALPPPFPSRPH